MVFKMYAVLFAILLVQVCVFEDVLCKKEKEDKKDKKNSKEGGSHEHDSHEHDSPDGDDPCDHFPVTACHCMEHHADVDKALYEQIYDSYVDLIWDTKNELKQRFGQRLASQRTGDQCVLYPEEKTYYKILLEQCGIAEKPIDCYLPLTRRNPEKPYTKREHCEFIASRAHALCSQLRASRYAARQCDYSRLFHNLFTKPRIMCLDDRCDYSKPE